MNRRWFLSHLAAGVVATPALVEALSPKPTIFLPARSGCRLMSLSEVTSSTLYWMANDKFYVFESDSSRMANPHGHGMRGIVIDDPVASRSVAVDWWNESLRKRGETGVAVCVQSRIHEDDLRGHVLESMPGDWAILRV
jgi:hypothetical protein